MSLTSHHRLHRISVLTKAGLVLSIGLFGLLVAWTNVTAYTINFQFVQHVLSMDALASWAQVDALTQRAITDPALHQFAYAAIILAEFVVGLLCSVGGLLFLITVFSQSDRHLAIGKAFALAGCAIGLAVWYLGFAVIGAEYFAMWASDWNGQTTAYSFSAILLLSMIYVAQPEAGATAPTPTPTPSPTPSPSPSPSPNPSPNPNPNPSPNPLHSDLTPDESDHER